RMSDVVEPMGAVFKLPMPLLWQHNADKPVGNVRFAKPTKDGIPYVATLPKVKEAGALKDRIDEAVQSIKYRLVAAVSIGFRAMKDGVEPLKSGGLRFTKWEWMELSLVTIPANADATITSIKSLDAALLASSGRKVVLSPHPPDVSGAKKQPAQAGFFTSERNPKGTQVKTIQELREARTTKAARMGELMQMKKEGQFGDAERAEFDELDGALVTIDDEIRELNFHARNASGAREVRGATQNQASQSRSRTAPTSFGQPDDAFAGQSFVRRCIAQALAGLNHSSK